MSSLKKSYIIICPDLDHAIDFANQYAPEHLILATQQWKKIIPKIINAGSVFCGYYSPESAGDYASGTNHVLPTGGFAKSYSGLSISDFYKTVSFQHLTKKGLKNLGATIEIMAENEQLIAHKNAVSVRLS